MAIAAPLTLREGDRARLEALARSAVAWPRSGATSTDHADVSGGFDEPEIGRKTWATRPKVTSWRNRYATAGIDALVDLPRPGRPPVVDELGVVATTLAHGGPSTSAFGVSQWSSRLLDQHLGISFTTVRTWRKWGLQPDVGTFTFAADRK